MREKIFSHSVLIINYFLIYILAVSCTQIKEVKNKTNAKVDFNSFSTFELTFPQEGNFVQPKFGLNDSTIFFLTHDLSSLYNKKFKSKNLIKIYSSKSKITDFIPVGNDDSVFIVERNYSPKANYKSRLLLVYNQKVKDIFSSAEVISNLTLTVKKNLAFFKGSQIKFYNFITNQITEKSNDDFESVFIDSTSIIFYSKDKTDKINLTNHQSVAWVSKISNDSLLIYSSEDKLILLSLKLKDIVKIGDYTSPIYNAIYKKIAVVEVSDNGMKEIMSDVFLLELNLNKTINLTKTPSRIESGIQWSHDGKKLAFAESGQIKIISFSQNNPITK